MINTNTMIYSKKDIIRIWNSIEPSIEKLVGYTGVDIPISSQSESYIALELNKKRVFFIFNFDDSQIDIFCREDLPVAFVEKAVYVQQMLIASFFKKQAKISKMSKME